MSKGQNSFYDEFAKNDFFEKQASENENIKKTISGLSPDVLEKIAQEIDAISNVSSVQTLEEKLAGESCDEEDKKDEEENKESSDCESPEDDKDKKDEEEDKESSDDDKKDEDETKESSEDPEGDAQSKARNNANTSNADPEGDALSAARNNANTSNADPEGDAQNEIKKQAYELAQSKLERSGLTVQDYVLSKVANEDIAVFIAENAEKLASLSDNSALQFADEIISSVEEKLG